MLYAAVLTVACIFYVFYVSLDLDIICCVMLCAGSVKLNLVKIIITRFPITLGQLSCTLHACRWRMCLC